MPLELPRVPAPGSGQPALGRDDGWLLAARQVRRLSYFSLAGMLAEVSARLRLIARGLSNDEIAGRLVISPLTAKSHVRNILRKLDCHDRAGLVAIAYESGLITPGEQD
jgi:DNA-binding CsgD family transcriptional regulator